MAFLDFIKNRNASPQQSVAKESQQPETAKQMYTREAAQAKSKPVEQISPDEKAKAADIGTDLKKTMGLHGPDGNGPAPAGGAASPEAVRQNMTGQNRAAEALSPTNMHSGKPVEKETKEPEKPKSPAPTVPRPRPSWER
jgi:hypothetical protein